MAEVVGIIASGAGIATLGGQILESVFKLQQIFTDIRDAPEELKTILEEIAIVTNVLIDCSQQSRSSPIGTTQSGARDQALLYCESACRSLFAIVSEIENGIRGPKSRSRWYGFLAVLKAKKIANLVSRLERAKSTLALAQLMYLQSRGTEQHDCKAGTSLVATVQKPEYLSSSTVVRQRGPKKYRTSYRETRYHLLIGILIVRHLICADEVNLSSPEDVKLEFRFAEWFLAWGVNIATRRESGLFNVAIRTYRIVPSNSAIFRACAMGDDEAVIRLIQEGKASPFDMTSNGLTPLHVAAAYSRPSTSKQLLDYGADGSLAVDNFDNTINSLGLVVDGWIHNEYLFPGLEGYKPKSGERHLRMRETMRVLIEHASIEVHQGYEPEDSGYWNGSTSALHFFNGTSEDFLWLIKREDAFLNAKEWDDYIASIVIYQTVVAGDSFPAAFSLVSNIGSLAKLKDQEEDTMLHYLLASCYGDKPGYLWSDLSIFKFVRILLEHGADPTARNTGGNNPLMFAAQNVLKFFWYNDLHWTVEAATEFYSEFLTLWVQTLESCNIDMQECRAKEIEAGAEEFKICTWILEEAPEEFIPGLGNKHWFVRLVFEQGDPTKHEPLQIRLEFRSINKGKIMPGTWTDDLEDYPDYVAARST